MCRNSLYAPLLTLAALAATTAHAEMIFSDLGPGNTFNGTSALGVAGPGTGMFSAVAAEFTAAIDGTIGTIHLGLNNFGPPTEGVTVSVWTVNGNVPGTQLASWARRHPGLRERLPEKRRHRPVDCGWCIRRVDSTGGSSDGCDRDCDGHRQLYRHSYR